MPAIGRLNNLRTGNNKKTGGLKWRGMFVPDTCRECYDAGSHPLDFPHGPIKRGTLMTLGVWLKISQNNKFLKHIVHTFELVSHNF